MSSNSWKTSTAQVIQNRNEVKKDYWSWNIKPGKKNMSGNHLYKIPTIFICGFVVFVQRSLETDFKNRDVFAEKLKRKLEQMKCKNYNSYLMRQIDLSLGSQKSHLILIQTKPCKHSCH